MSTVVNLNCWVQGDDIDRIFPVEIAPTKTVGALKDVIKEKKKHAFRDIDADILVLWEVSIRIDDNFDKNLEKRKHANPLLPWQKLSSVFLDQPADGHLSIVIKAPAGECGSFSAFVMIPDFTSLPRKRGFRATST